MKTSIKFLAVILAAAALGGCASGFKATYDHDASHDFSGYKTYAWISDSPMKVGPSVGAPNPLLQPRIMRAVEDVLFTKGYDQVTDPKTADFVLAFTVGSREEIKVQSYPSMSMGYAGYPNHWRWGGSYYCCATDTEVRQYTKGMLSVDVFDVKEQRPVWHGVASKTIRESDRENIEATVNAAVTAILEGFPPK